MKKNSPDIFKQPRRQASNALIFIALDTIWGAIRQLWVFILIYFFSQPDYGSLFFILITVLFSAGVLFTSIVSYFRFYYYIDENKLHVKKGVFRRSHISVPLERIQSVHIEDNVIHRFFNTVQVEVTSAGSGEREFSIRSIDKEEAEELKTYILSKKRSLNKKSSRSVSFESIIGLEEEEDEQPLFSLDLTQLFKVGLSQNHFRAIGLILGAAAYLLTQAQEVVGGDIFDWAYRLLGWTDEASWKVIALILFALLVLALLISIVGTVFRYFGLKVFISDKQIRVKHGLLQMREQTAQLKKIQILDWNDNPVRRRMNFVTVGLRQATSSQEEMQNSINLPGCKKEDRSSLIEKIFKRINVQPSNIQLHPSMIWRYTLFRGGIPALIAAAASYNLFSWYCLLFFIWVPISYWINLRVYHNWNIMWDNDHLSIKRGFWTNSVSIMAWYKIQAVDLRQTPYQSRNQIANFWLYTAGGNLMIPYMHWEDAVKLRDFVLYKAESTKRSWM